MRIKFKASVVLASLLALSACSSSDASVDSTTSVASTVAPQSAVCSKSQIEVAVGEPANYFVCSGDWAATQPDSYVESCNDCEQVWLLKWEVSSWSLKGSCSQYSPLTPQAVCRKLSGTITNSKSEEGLLAEFPPPANACDIWVINKDPQYVAETGCSPA
jgi:hypothetical protein